MSGRVTLQQLRRGATSLSWATVDQVLFALSNLVITLAVARGGGAEGLGRYAVAFSVYLVVLGCARSLISEPLLATPRSAHDRLTDGAAATLTVAYAVVVGVVVAGVGLALDRVEIVVVAMALPVTLLHDALRYSAFRQQSPAIAAYLDAGWLLGSALAWPLVTQTDSVAVAVACWSAGAALALLLAVPVLRPTFAPPAGAVRWWTGEARSYATPLLLDSIVVVFSTQALVVVLVTLASDRDLGVLRAAQVYFAPLGLAMTALGVLVVPKLTQRSGGTSNTVALHLSVGIATLAALLSGTVLAAEPLLRRLLFAESIVVPRSLLVPLAVGLVLVGGSSGLMIVSKARRRSGDIARSRLSSAALGVVVMVIGVAAFGVHGAAWALVLQTLWYTVALAVRVARTGRALDAGQETKEPSLA